MIDFEEAKKRFGFVPDSPDMFLKLKGIEYLNFIADIFEFTAVSINQCGKGKCLYIAGSLLMLRQYTQQTFAKELLKEYLPVFVTETENLPGSVEITRLRSKDGSTLLVGVVNYQDELPNIPLYNVSISFDAGFVPVSIKRASDGADCDFSVSGTIVKLTIPRLDDGDIFEIK